ncbi:MAG: dihydrolipoamide acetyltransferase family protein [Planctomycetaceae bacterium]
MAVNVVMPQMGESIAEGTITKWLKKPGDKIAKDEALLEISTDKVDTEIPAPAAGVLGEIVAPEGKTVEVGSVIARILVGGEAPGVAPAPAPAAAAGPAPAPAPAKAAARPAPPAPPPTPAPPPPRAEPVVAAGAAGKVPRQVEGRFLSPLVRSIAAAEGIGEQALKTIPGSGAGGRVTKKDMLSFLEARPADGRAPAVAVADRTLPMDRMRTLIAQHMVHSIQTSAHVYTFTECDMTAIVEFREKCKAAFEERTGEKLTFTAFFVKAAALALREFPYVNAQVNPEKGEVTLKGRVNVGMAVAVPQKEGTYGLIVPVVRDADALPLREIARQVNDLARRGREGALKPDEPQGGTFSITNMGVFGSLGGLPILNQPQVGILGIGAIQKRPAVYRDQIAIRHLVLLSLGFDHRLVDGALGGQFLERIRHHLENFEAWLLA